MGIRQYKPTSKGRRHGTVSDFADITDKKKKPEKALLVRAKKKGGRNNQGIVTTRFRGGGHKQMYRQIDFKRRKDGVEATVVSIEYDPNRTCRIALLQYPDGARTLEPLLRLQMRHLAQPHIAHNDAGKRIGYALPGDPAADTSPAFPTFVHLPADQAAHPSSAFEWWYVVGHLTGGGRLAVEPALRMVVNVDESRRDDEAARPDDFFAWTRRE